MVTIFCGLNFRKDKFSWVRVAHRNYHVAYFLAVQMFIDFIFAGVACPQKLVPNQKFVCLQVVLPTCSWLKQLWGLLDLRT